MLLSNSKPITKKDYSDVCYSKAPVALGYAGGDTYVDGSIIAVVERGYDGIPVVVDQCEYLEARYLCL